ncbi:efflux RND transporter permease subunit [Candidatus Odyssella thessalonicensis]|uniref:efflux RND transporter permease subunit n=1 Tax=Candidatus Odyssella thessalonicensis TaxID=84647 RepID=UPI000225C146|nr:efflux RND transporter permease subunit [Candidatus Odyssella thessalonicensis]
MKFTDLFIKRPVLSGVISTLILLLGLKAIASLQVRQYPELTNTVITVTTAYPGATADLMQGFVTNPIQRSIAAAEGVDYVTSTSRQGISVVSAYIRLNFPPDTALTEVSAKVQEIISELPREVESPIIKKTTGEAYAILYASFSSDQLSKEQITDYINRQIQPRLATVLGVSQVEVIGGQTFAMRIWLDPQKMAAREISAADIAAALEQNNYQSAPGETKGYLVIKSVNANTGLSTPEQFAKIIVKSKGDAITRLQDVADIELAAQSYDSVVKMNGQKSVFIGIKTSPTANPLTVVKEVRKTLDLFSPNFPPSLKMEIAYDATKFIQASIDEVVKTLFEASLIVIVVIFLFLGSLRAVFIPVITIPLSIIGVATVLLVLGFSINILTLLAMVLAIGLVVDDAIVVVENVYRHLRDGKSPQEAALIGTREIAVPVISMTITLVAVYAPIAFMGGLTGTLFREFALTLAGSVVISGIIALTLSPMMCSKILTKESMESKFAHKVEAYFDNIAKAYEARLTKVIHNRRFIVFCFGTILLLTSLFMPHISKELAPQEDQGIVMMATKGPQDANIDFMEYYSDQIIKQLMNYEERDLLFTIAGMDTVNSGFGGLIVKPWSERKRTTHKIQESVQEDLNHITGVRGFVFQPSPLPGNAGGMPVQFVVNSLSDYQIIYKLVEDLKIAAMKSGLFIVVDSDLAYNQPAIQLDIDHDKANELGISMQSIGRTLSTFMGGNYINRFNLLGRSYQVIPQAARVERLSEQSLKDFYVATASGKQISLATIAKSKIIVEPNLLPQFNQINSATFQAVPMPWIKLGDAISFLEKYAKENFPQGVTYDFLSESRQYIKEGNALIQTFLFALIIIFLVLAAQFESLRDPFIVMLSVPMSIFGAILMLFIGFSTMNIYSQIGLVTLIGLITKHGILIVEFANQLRDEHNLSKQEAVIQAAMIRLRPIMMTTAAMVVGLLPLLTASGAGSASRFSIGITIVAGMLIGTFFTVFVVPSFYVMIAADKRAKVE